MTLTDKNGIEIKTGNIVKIEGGFFKADNGTFLVKHSPGDPSWSGSDYCLTKCNKKGVESEAKYSTAFWPLMVTVSSREKGIAAHQHNKEHATIEIISSVKVYELSVKETRGWNDYEYKEIATEKRYQELLTYNRTKVEIISESVNGQKAGLQVPVVEEVKPSAEVIEADPITTVESSEPVEAVEVTTTTIAAPTLSLINESLAQRSKENMSFSDYKPGSATAEFNAEIAEVTAKIESAKLRVSEEGQIKLDHLLTSYTSRYAAWTNKRNANGASHVSVMIAGPAKYNMRAHEKYMTREGKLWAEYDEFKNIYNRIDSIVAGDRIIKSNDTNAIEKLQAKLEGLQRSQELMKAANAIIRKKKLTDEQKITEMVEAGLTEDSAKEALTPNFMGRIGFASYSLTNNNANISNVKQRIEKLQREHARGTQEIIIESVESENGIRIVDNVEAARLQIFFPGKPDANTRTELKHNRFRWTPSIGAWQSYRSDRANEVARRIAKAI